uniref:Photosystem II 12 kDa extrinsic protein n=1 Tax=Corethron hystrix TaxID=216773 RepID=A0A7S1BBM0_9STRA|mmetsp:Transcript_19135/g.43561  ORF Transcript_19135/g.43561 Transcript_19135/m.43561 type:complete len:170 (+) Transcript_19135:95-604(+)
MKRFATLFLSTAAAVSAFQSSTSSSVFAFGTKVNREDFKLDMATRRDTINDIIAITTSFVVTAQPVQALNSIPKDNEIVKEQRTVVTKLDVNNAPVADYMQYPGMYPTIAGKIANNGPYNSIKDVYKLKLLSQVEKSTIKKYEKELSATRATGLDTMRGRDPYRRSFNR